MSPTKQAKSKATVARNQNSIRWQCQSASAL